MPGKEELFSKLLFLIQSPAQRLATVINATGRDLAVVINQASRRTSLRARRLRLLQPHLRRKLLPSRCRSRPAAEAPAPEAQLRKHRLAEAVAVAEAGRAAFGRGAAGKRHGVAGWRSRDHGAGRRLTTSFAAASAGAPVWAQRKPWKAVGSRERSKASEKQSEVEHQSLESNRRNNMADIQQLEDQSLASACSRLRRWSRSSKSVSAFRQQQQLRQPRQRAAARQQRLRPKRRPSSPSSSRMPARTRSPPSRLCAKSPPLA